MGLGPSLPDEIDASEVNHKTFPIVMTPEAMEIVNRKNGKVEDDYPVDKFAGKGFFQKKSDPSFEEVRVKAEELMREYPIAEEKQIPCAELEESVRRCYRSKGDKLDCDGEVEAFLQCSKASLFNRLASIGNN